MNTNEMMNALDALEREKGIKKEIMIPAIENSFVSAYKKKYGTGHNIKVVMDRESGEISAYFTKRVVETVMDNGVEKVEILKEFKHEKFDEDDEFYVSEYYNPKFDETKAAEFYNNPDDEAVEEAQEDINDMYAPIKGYRKLNKDLEISLEEARKISPDYNVGDSIDIKIEIEDFNRISAQAAKQVIIQKIRETERIKIYNEFVGRRREICVAYVQPPQKTVQGGALPEFANSVDGGNIVVSIDNKVDAVLPAKEQIPGEVYKFNDRMKVYILSVEDPRSQKEARGKKPKDSKGPKITVSRTHSELVKRLLELEVPEIADGTVEIKRISREAGIRTKIAVYSKDPKVDPVGACIGEKSSYINNIRYDINRFIPEFINDSRAGEKIDIIRWSENIEEFVSSALGFLSPSAEVSDKDKFANLPRVKSIHIVQEPQIRTVKDDEGNTEHIAVVDENGKAVLSDVAKVIVNDDHLSLAIGKSGQNVRLAAKLTGVKIDIRSESQAKEELM